jgi:dephospho-CoA kinase
MDRNRAEGSSNPEDDINKELFETLRDSPLFTPEEIEFIERVMSISSDWKQRVERLRERQTRDIEYFGHALEIFRDDLNEYITVLFEEHLPSYIEMADMKVAAFLKKYEPRVIKVFKSEPEMRRRFLALYLANLKGEANTALIGEKLARDIASIVKNNL